MFETSQRDALKALKSAIGRASARITLGESGHSLDSLVGWEG